VKRFTEGFEPRSEANAVSGTTEVQIPLRALFATNNNAEHRERGA